VFLVDNVWTNAGRNKTADVAKRQKFNTEGEGNASKELLITTCCVPQITATAFKIRKLVDRMGDLSTEGVEIEDTLAFSYLSSTLDSCNTIEQVRKEGRLHLESGSNVRTGFTSIRWPFAFHRQQAPMRNNIKVLLYDTNKNIAR